MGFCQAINGNSNYFCCQVKKNTLLLSARLIPRGSRLFLNHVKPLENLRNIRLPFHEMNVVEVCCMSDAIRGAATCQTSCKPSSPALRSELPHPLCSPDTDLLPASSPAAVHEGGGRRAARANELHDGRAAGAEAAPGPDGVGAAGDLREPKHQRGAAPVLPEQWSRATGPGSSRGLQPHIPHLCGATASQLVPSHCAPREQPPRGHLFLLLFFLL